MDVYYDSAYAIIESAFLPSCFIHKIQFTFCLCYLRYQPKNITLEGRTVNFKISLAYVRTELTRAELHIAMNYPEFIDLSQRGRIL